MNAILNQEFDEHLRVLEATRSRIAEPLAAISSAIAKSMSNGGTLLLCGNGGSAADSQHIAAEFIGRFKKNRRPLRSLALTTDTSGLTCISNDFSYDDVFSRQVEALGRPGDVLLAITTSGNSPNVINAIEKAKEIGVLTVAFLGKGGGKCAALADHNVIVPSDTTARIQEMHIFMAHIMCELVEKELGFA